MIFSGFILGLISSLHCVGMCGPIALSLGLNQQSRVNLYFKNFTYQLGRVITYTLFGLLIGIFGNGLQLVSSQQFISIFVGTIMLLSVFVPKTISTKLESKKIVSNFLLQLKLKLGKLLGEKSYNSLFTIGLLNGLLPCGPVYIALTAAVASKSIFDSGLFMFLYGLGTIPLMFLTVLLGNTINQEFRNKLYKIYPLLIFMLGILFILRGLDLNIPYISPSDKALQINAKESCH